MSDNLEPRQKALLKIVVESFIRTAEPVGSKFLTEEGSFEVSGATLRNELRALEEKGYLTHPHTSAGRVPTENGYRLYVQELMDKEVPSKKIKTELSSLLGASEGVERAKILAKYVSQYTDAAVIMAHHEHSLYYTGLSRLFAQPELLEGAHALNISTMFDQCEERIGLLYRAIDGSVQIFIGRENPLGTMCGTVVCRLGKGLIAIVGPMRMNYARVIGITEYLLES